MMLTPASASCFTFALPSAGPFAPHREVAHGPDCSDSLVLDNYYAISQRMTAKTVDKTTAHQCKRACLDRYDYETKQKCSSKIKIHGLRHATLSSAFARALRSGR